MLKIELKNLLFRANHGLYEAEKRLGGSFEVDLWLTYSPKTMPVTDINDTIDYSAVFDVVKERMNQPEELLETLVTKLAFEILEKFALANEVYVRVNKIHPPIPVFSGSAGVSYQVRRDEL